jgi:bifunctional DNA-binding transcriptional regulator/antitoxin component of YhaV-PrlF toxin-antitoxin module
LTGEPVMQLLAPMTPLYLRRAGVEGRSRGVEQPHLDHRATDDALEPCVLQAVVTVDSKGRVPWPIKDGRLGAGVVSIAVVGNHLVEVELCGGSQTRVSVPDGRGRLQLPRGLLEASGFSAGDRLAIVQLGDSSKLVLTSAANLAVRRSTA